MFGGGSSGGGDGKGGGESPYQILWRSSTLGLELVGAILVMGFIGWLVDGWLGTEPVGMLIGGAVGIVGGGYRFIRDAKQFADAASRMDASARVGRGGGERRGGGGDGGMFERESHEILPEDYEAADEALERALRERDGGGGEGDGGGGESGLGGRDGR